MDDRLPKLLSLLLFLGTPGAAQADVTTIPNAGGDSCGTRIREAGPGDILIRERNLLMGAPENANNAPGPGSLRVVVRANSLRHSFIFIEDTTKGTSRRMGQGSMPRFSPDGRWIACIRWLSYQRPYNLALLDIRTGSSIALENLGYIGGYAWSPDSKRLAFTSMPRDSIHRWDIGWIDAADKSVHVLASDFDYYVEYNDCEWAPDNRRFVVNRQRENEHDDSVYARDLWLFDVEGRPCRLTHTPRRDEDFPGWIDNRHIRYESGWSDDESAGRLRYVIELVQRPERR